MVKDKDPARLVPHLHATHLSIHAFIHVHALIPCYLNFWISQYYTIMAELLYFTLKNVGLTSAMNGRTMISRYMRTKNQLQKDLCNLSEFDEAVI